MNERKLQIKELLIKAVKDAPKGQFIPDVILNIFIARGLDSCLKKNWLNMAPIVQFLSGEYDFSSDEISALLSVLSDKVFLNAGVEILHPGDSFPPEALDQPPAKQEEELELELESDEDDKLDLVEEEDEEMVVASAPAKANSKAENENGDSLEWRPSSDSSDEPTPPPNGFDMPIVRIPPNERVSADEVKPASPLTAALKEAADSRTTPPPSTPPKPKAKRKFEYSISKEDAASILFEIVRGGTNVDPAIWRIASNNVLKSDVEKGIISNSLDNSPTMKLIRDALAWRLALEADFAIYSGARKIEGLVVSAAVKLSAEMAANARSTIKALEAEAGKYSRTKTADRADLLNYVATGLKESVGKIDEVIAALSYIPDKNYAPRHEKFTQTAETAKKKSEKAAAVERKKTPDKIRKYAVIAAAATFVAASLVGSGLYLQTFFVKGTDKPMDPSQYREIISLREAKLLSSSFVGVVDAETWKNLSPEEKSSRATKLFETVRNDKVRGLLLVGPDKHRVAQTYGDQVKIF